MAHKRKRPESVCHQQLRHWVIVGKDRQQQIDLLREQVAAAHRKLTASKLELTELRSTLERIGRIAKSWSEP